MAGPGIGTSSGFRGDQRRQNVVALADWTMLRYTWHDLIQRPARVVAEIRTALAARTPGLSPSVIVALGVFCRISGKILPKRRSLERVRPVHERHQPGEHHRRPRSHEVTTAPIKPPHQTQTHTI